MDQVTECNDRACPWFPFNSGELELAFGLYGFLATALSFAGASTHVLAASGLAYAAFAYLAGLLVHARRQRVELELLTDGAVGGAGYISPFRKARRCLYLMHVDDDVPTEELLALYRSLLTKGVYIRRLIFLRSDHRADSMRWLNDFGGHPYLEQRLVDPRDSRMIRFSFAIVDQSEAILAVPGAEAIDTEPYAVSMILRHLVRIRNGFVAKVFLEMHEQMWGRATPVALSGHESSERSLSDAH